MKNIVFDLGGVLFARDKSKCTPELLEFFSFLRAPRMPLFWEEYDRGTSTLSEVTRTISGMTGRSYESCAAVLQLAVDLQEPVKPKIFAMPAWMLRRRFLEHLHCIMRRAKCLIPMLHA